MSSPEAQIVKRFREATGMGWMDSKLFLAERSAELCDRILRAGAERVGPTLHDPIEDDTEFADAIATAREEAERIAKAEIVQENDRLAASVGRERSASGRSGRVTECGIS